MALSTKALSTKALNTVAAKPKTLGQLIDTLNAIRQARRKLAEEDSKLASEFSEVEAQVKDRLIAEETDKATGRTATVSLSRVTVASVTDWELVYALIKKTGAFHLLHRRVSDPAFRELYELEYNKLSKKRGFDPEALDTATVVPGFKPFEKLQLNLTALKAAA